MKTWILIADAAHARVLETVGTGKPLTSVPAFSVNQSLPPSRDLGTDRPTRTHDSLGASRHGVEAHSDPRRELKRKFAGLVVEKLEAALAVHAFSRLVLVAPPAMLGDIRQALSKPLLDRVVAEIDKDLVKVSDHDIRAHLSEVTGI
jgi:protein required for attachment to host cells